METQKTLNSWNSLEKEKQSWRNHAPSLQPILQGYSHQKKKYGTGTKYWHIDQQKRIESPEINSHIYGWSIYEKEARIHNEENTVFLVSGAGKTG